MRFGTFCSGIGAPEAALCSLGWTPAFFSEIEAFPCAVLAEHFPGVPNWGDMTKINDEQIKSAGPVDLVCAGTPCQSFSVAGLRKGMADPRGNLALAFLGLLDRIRPRWMVWENVPGVLSSWSDETPGEDGERWQSNDFDTFLCGLRELGYGVAWRILDAQYLGVPQRRRRVFVVGHLGDWRRAAAVLFERHSLSGDPPPSREAGKEIAASLTRGADSSGKGGYAGRRREDETNLVTNALDAHMGMGGPDDNAAQANHIIPAQAYGPGGDRGIAASLNAHGVRLDMESETFIAHSLRAEGFDASEDGTGQVQLRDLRQGNYGESGSCGDSPVDGINDQVPGLHPVAFKTRNGRGQPEEVCPTLQGSGAGATSDMRPCVAFQERGRAGGPNVETQEDVAYSLTAPNGGGRRQEMNVATPTMAVRRLTPLECERLQGLPDGWTAVPFRGKVAADGPRYRAIGNSMAVPVLSWIGKRIMEVANALP